MRVGGGRRCGLLCLVNLDRSTSPIKNVLKGLVVCHVLAL